MKPSFLTLAALAWALAAPAWSAAPDANLRLEAGSRLWLEGDSTLHAYSSAASTFAVLARVAAAAPSPYAKGLRALEVRVPVSGLLSGKSALDRNLRKALKAEKHPDIFFKMTGYSAPVSTAAVVQGTLSVAGRQRPVALSATLEAREGGARATGSADLLMSDFGVDPPTMFLGALKTADKVVVRYDLLLTKD